MQLPGVSDPQQAERVLGGTAQLDFRRQRPGTEQLRRHHPGPAGLRGPRHIRPRAGQAGLTARCRSEDLVIGVPEAPKGICAILQAQRLIL